MIAVLRVWSVTIATEARSLLLAVFNTHVGSACRQLATHVADGRHTPGDNSGYTVEADWPGVCIASRRLCRKLTPRRQGFNMSTPIAWNQLFGRLGDGDEIAITVTPIANGFLEIVLKSAPEIRWWKGLQVLNAQNRIFWSIWTQDDRHDSSVDGGPIRLPAARDLLDGWSLEICKAKLFGAHTGMYRLPMIALNSGAIDGVRLTFEWRRD